MYDGVEMTKKKRECVIFSVDKNKTVLKVDIVCSGPTSTNISTIKSVGLPILVLCVVLPICQPMV